MENIKNKQFVIGNNPKKNVIEVVDKKNKIKMLFRRHKFILSVITTTTMLVILNIILIQKFFELMLTL